VSVSPRPVITNYNQYAYAVVVVYRKLSAMMHPDQAHKDKAYA